MNFEIRNVSLTIDGKSIVKDVSITVCPGEIVGLIGPNGAGKTSTFNLAVGNLKPDKGDILMNDKFITNLPLPNRAKLGLGYLTQEPSIFRNLTVKQNIDLALQNKVNNWTGHGPSVSESKLMQLRDISECLLFPSASEGFGYPPLEALASGLPVMCADLPSHNELMPEDYCLPADDMSSWKDSIIEVYQTWKSRGGKPRQFSIELVEHAKKFDNTVSVSYTHLTLPTNREV